MTLESYHFDHFAQNIVLFSITHVCGANWNGKKTFWEGICLTVTMLLVECHETHQCQMGRGAFSISLLKIFLSPKISDTKKNTCTHLHHTHSRHTSIFCSITSKSGQSQSDSSSQGSNVRQNKLVDNCYHWQTNLTEWPLGNKKVNKTEQDYFLSCCKVNGTVAR